MEKKKEAVHAETNQETKLFAPASWSIKDIQNLAEEVGIEITDKQAEEFLEEFAREIESEMIGAGWHVISKRFPWFFDLGISGKRVLRSARAVSDRAQQAVLKIMKANEKTAYKCCICDETATHFLSTHDGEEASCFAVCDDCYKLDNVMADYEMTDAEAIAEAARAAGYPESKQPKLSEWLEDYCASCLACGRMVYEWCTCVDNAECHECFERLHTY